MVDRTMKHCTLEGARERHIQGLSWRCTLYYQDSMENSDKFWEGYGENGKVIIRWGRRGTIGQKQQRDWPTFVERYQAKIGKGYLPEMAPPPVSSPFKITRSLRPGGAAEKFAKEMAEKAKETSVSVEPVTPDPVTPDPVTPDPVTPDPDLSLSLKDLMKLRRKKAAW